MSPAKLVAIGDSLTQGFQSGSIFKTRFSYPALLAERLGAGPFLAPDFSGEGGLPVNIEHLVRMLERRFGAALNFAEIALAGLGARSFLDRVEDYWERGDGRADSSTGPVHHNLAVWGFDVEDADTLTEALCRRFIPHPTDDVLRQVPEFSMYRTARRTLNPSFRPAGEDLTQIEAARRIAQQQGGIEKLLFALGANNALGTVTHLKIEWSEEADLFRFAHERRATLWTPQHFERVYRRVAEKVAQIGADEVYVANVPYVTIPPVSRGITPGAPPGEGRDPQGYYEYYTRFWVWDEDFSKDPTGYPRLTREQVRRIDQVIDEYNLIIADEAQKRNWRLVDLNKALADLAFRRSGGRPRYQFPKELVAALKANPKTGNRFTQEGRPILDTRYLRIDTKQQEPDRRFQGGIFSLDGAHPTTIGYGLVAHEFLKVMGETARADQAWWGRIIEADTLVTETPETWKTCGSFWASSRANARCARSSSPCRAFPDESFPR
jgi:lysophospholipase L1-like esterase